MNADMLFRAVGDVGDDLIARAACVQTVRTAGVWKKWAAAAACAAFVIALGALALPRLAFDGAKMKGATAEAPAAAEPAAAVEEENDAMAEEYAAEECAPAEAAPESALIVTDEPEIPAKSEYAQASGEAKAELTLCGERYLLMDADDPALPQSVREEDCGKLWTLSETGGRVYRYGEDSVLLEKDRLYPARVVVFSDDGAAFYRLEKEAEH